MIALLASVALTAATPCAPLPGFDAVLARPGVTYVLFGEYHGTAEIPAFVGDAACLAAQTGRPLVVGIELTPADQPAIDAFMASDGGRAARAALLASPGWRERGGRTTEAIADLIDTARRLGKRRRVRVVAFDASPEPAGTSPKREAAMAATLAAAAAAAPKSLVVALTGVGHADKEGFTSSQPPFLAAAGRLPPQATVSLAFARPGGSYWGCATPTGDASRGCTAYEMPVREPVATRGITLDATLRGGFDGIYSVGARYTPSRPAIL